MSLETWPRYWQKGHVKRLQNSLHVYPHLNRQFREIKFPGNTIFPRDREIKDSRNVPRKFSRNLSPAKIKENKVACELDMINVLSAADNAFIMSSSTPAWLLSPLECSPQKQNGWTLCFCFRVWIMWKMYNKTINIEFGFRMISWIIKTSCLCYLPQPSASTDNTDLGFDNSWYHAQPHPIIVY